MEYVLVYQLCQGGVNQLYKRGVLGILGLELDESQTKEDPSIFVRASTIRPGHTCSYVCMYIYILPHKRENTRVLRRSSKISTILYTCRYILTWCDKTCLTMSTSVILVERFHLRFRILD